MQLKNALAVCLISLCAATLVVWIARALDMQAASRIQPQLAEIAEELRAMRRQTVAADERLVAYFFHRKERCPSCLAIEAQTTQVLETTFADALRRGVIEWRAYDYELPIAEPLVKRFNVDPPIVVLAKMRGDRLVDHRVLGDVMSLHGDKAAFAEYMESQIREMTAPAKTSPAVTAAVPSTPKRAKPAGATPPAELDLPVPDPEPEAKPKTPTAP